MSYEAYLARLQAEKTLPDHQRELYQQIVDYGFDNASDVYDVNKFDPSTKMYSLLMSVRITNPYSLKAVSVLKDDHRLLIFRNGATPTSLGDMYQFQGYEWLCVDTGLTKSVSYSAQVSRCADFLRFYDDDGVYHSIPSVIQKGVLYDLNTDKMISIPDNQLRIFITYDEASKKIKWADGNSKDTKYTRFILEGIAYRVVSVDRHTYVRLGTGFVDIRLQTDQITTNDDLVNNIADAFAPKNDVRLTLVDNVLDIGTSQTSQLNPILTKDGIEISNPQLTYTSSNNNIVAVNTSGLVTGVSVGMSTVTVSFGSVSATATITVVAMTQDNFAVEFGASNSNLTTIKLNQQVTYSSTFINNGTPYSSTRTWTLTDDTGLAPTTLATVVSSGTDCVIKATSNSVNVNGYFRLYCADLNVSSYIRIQLKSLF